MILESKSDRVFVALNAVFLLTVVVIVLYPLIYVVSAPSATRLQ